MQDNDTCFISDKLKDKLSPQLLAKQSNPNYNTPYHHEFDDSSIVSNMVQISFIDDKLIYGVLQSVVETNDKIKIKLHIELETFATLLKNQMSLIIITNNNTILQEYKIDNNVKKCIKIVNNQYIRLKLDFCK
tara:strand:- start:308 stop:706 length:399 start_codon:yes stop_codon:yes gene_type:complete